MLYRGDTELSAYNQAYSDGTLAISLLEHTKTLAAKNCKFRLSIKVYRVLSLIMSPNEQETSNIGNDKKENYQVPHGGIRPEKVNS